MEDSRGRTLEVVSTPWRRWADGVAQSARANCCFTRRFLLATPPGAGPCQMQPPPAEPLASGLVMHCALGAVTSSESQKKDTKRATSCEVALSKRLVGWGSLNQLLMLLILNGLAVSSLTAVLPLVLLVIKSPHIFAIVAYRSTPRKSQPGCRLLRALATNF